MTWIFLGLWFLCQLVMANFGLFAPASGGGTAFFTHVGDFISGLAVTKVLWDRGRIRAARPAIPDHFDD